MFMRVVNTGSQHGNCYVLKSNSGEMLLLDCGCKYKDILKAIDYRTSDVSGVLLTHEHGDHRESFKNLMNLGIQIYTNDETVEHLQIITGELMKGVPEKRPFRVGSFTVIPFYLPHTTRDKDRLIPISVLQDVKSRISDWLASGGKETDPYIQRQIDYLKAVEKAALDEKNIV